MKNSKNSISDHIYKGIFENNPVFVLLLGLCPTLGVTSSAVNGLAMGIATMFVLVFSNMLVSLIRRVTPNKIRIPCYIIIIASLVTLVQMAMEAYVPNLYKVLGLFIPLIVVNCIILGRAESFASKNSLIPSIFDGIGTGVGFTVALILIGGIREILGNGTLFSIRILPESFSSLIFILAPGAFLTIGFILAVKNYIVSKKEEV